MTVAFFAVYALRLAHGFSNIDDFLYARQTADYADAITRGPLQLVRSWHEYSTHSPLLAMLATPLTAISDSPHMLVLVQLPALLTLAWTITLLLGQLGVRGRLAWPAAAGITLLPPVLGYAAMYHFGIVATAAFVGSIGLYLASDRMRRRRPALLFGVALGLLSLSRVVALVYIAAILIPAGVDWLLDRGDWRSRLTNTGLGALASLVVAVPWWAGNARSTLAYLLGAGYDADSGFAEQTSLPARMLDRFTHTADETGWLLTALLVALLVPAFTLAVSHRDRRVLLPLASAGLTMVLLGTSSNAGTAFALPAVVVAAIVAAWWILTGAGRASMTATAAVIVATAMSLAGLFQLLPAFNPAGHPLWSHGTPADVQLEQALCLVPGLMETIKPGESDHGSTQEAPRRAA